MTQPLRILVTGVAGGSIGEQVCKALRLGRRRYDVLATNVNAVAAGVVSPWRTASLPRASDPLYLESVVTLVRAHGVRFVVPGSEPELLALSAARSVVEQDGVRLLANRHDVIRSGTDKIRTFAALGGREARIPRSFVLTNIDALARIEVRAPWIIKPARGAGGSANTFIAQDESELRAFVSYLLKSGDCVLVQEYVGRADMEFTIGVLHYPDGQLAGSVAMHRHITSGLSNRIRVENRTSRTDLGSVLAVSSGISQGEIGDFPEIRVQAERIAELFGSAGPLNVQGRIADGELIVFEINPRFSGTTPMRAMCGFNEPELLIDWHLGERDSAMARALSYGSFSRGLVEFFSPRD